MVIGCGSVKLDTMGRSSAGIGHEPQGAAGSVREAQETNFEAPVSGAGARIGTQSVEDCGSVFVAPAFTRSRNSLPGLKCGTYLPGSATDSPVFGLRPMRGGR